MEGYAEVLGSLSGEQITLKGLLNVKGDCELERFDAEGGYVIDGLLNAGFIAGSAGLEAGTIEGDDIDLEHTAASVVRGNRVSIGPGCRIGRVEYRSELSKHPQAQVREETKSADGSHFA